MGSVRGTKADQVKEEAHQRTGQVARQTRQKADQLTDQGRQQVKAQMATRKDQAAEKLGPIHMALHETAHQLNEQGQDSIGQYVDKAALQVERFSEYLRESDVDQLMGEAQSFARRKPAIFLGSALALGFFGSRFLKSSSGQGTGSEQDADSIRGGSPAAIEGDSYVGDRRYSSGVVEEPAAQTRERTEPSRGV